MTSKSQTIYAYTNYRVIFQVICFNVDKTFNVLSWELQIIFWLFAEYVYIKQFLIINSEKFDVKNNIKIGLYIGPHDVVL